MSRLPFLSFFQLSPRPVAGHLPVGQRNAYKAQGIWIYEDCGFKSRPCDLEQIAQPLVVFFLIRKETWED